MMSLLLEHECYTVASFFFGKLLSGLVVREKCSVILCF